MKPQRAPFNLLERAAGRYNLFLGIFPDRFIAEEIVSRAGRLRENLGLRGRIRPVDHLHVTLHFLGRCMEVPPELVPVMNEICGEAVARWPSFEVMLDRVLCFRNQRRESPVVLGGDQAGNAPLRELQGKLGEGLAQRGCRVNRSGRFVPHLTLLYDRRGLDETSIEPVSWLVREVVLVLSEVGATKYVRLGCWTLRE